MVSSVSESGVGVGFCSQRLVARLGFVLVLVLVLGWASSARAAGFSATTSTTTLPDGVNSGPNALAVGDVNGDGLPDLVTADGGPGTVSLLLNGGAGAFTPAADLGIAPTPNAIAVADLNGDGKPDIAVTQSTSNRLSLLFADPTGLAFSNEVDLTTGAFPDGVAIGDLNGDGLPDIAETNGTDGTLWLFDATSNGVYPTLPTTTLTVGTNPSAVAIADLNTDGLPDLVVANKTSGTVTVFIKNSGGTATGYATQTLTTGIGTGPDAVAIGDLNGDGNPDIVVADGTNGAKGNRVSIFDATSPGVYPSTPTTVLPVGTNPTAVVIGDFNGDGLPDFAVANKLDNTVTVFLKDAGDSGFTASPNVSVGNGPVSLATGDLVGDGKLDIATTNVFAGTVSLLANTTPQGTTTATVAGVPTSSTFGQSVSFSTSVAKVTNLSGAPAPTGSVTFSVDGVAQTPAALSAGAASFSTSALSAGAHTVTATYSGDSNYASSTSAPLTYNVAAVAPGATTGAASGITAAGASLAGTVSPNGSVTNYVFEYGTSTSFGSITAVNSVAGSSSVPVTGSLTGLLPDTTYFYRLVASNSAGTGTGAVASFATGGTPMAPAAVTLPASSVGNTAATLKGSVNPDGQATAFTFEYGTSTSFGTITTVTELDNAYSVEPVSAGLTGLASDTTYFYRVVASNSAGTSVGAVQSFATGPVGAPVVTTGAASNLGVSGATLSGTVNPDGQTTTFVFEYGQGNNFGSISAVDNAGTGQGAESVSLPITGLQPNTTYQYRIDATNASGTVTGVTKTLTTT